MFCLEGRDCGGIEAGMCWNSEHCAAALEAAESDAPRSAICTALQRNQENPISPTAVRHAAWRIQPTRDNPSRLKYSSSTTLQQVNPSRLTHSSATPTQDNPSRLTHSSATPTQVNPSRLTHSSATPTQVNPSRLTHSSATPTQVNPSRLTHSSATRRKSLLNRCIRRCHRARPGLVRSTRRVRHKERLVRRNGEVRDERLVRPVVAAGRGVGGLRG
jgi:hypothetical protein